MIEIWNDRVKMIKNGKLPFYALFTLIMLLLFLKYALLVSIPSIVFGALFAVIAFFGNQNEIFAVCICCIPLSTAVPYYYIVLFCAVVYLLKYRENIRVDAGFIPILLLVAWELLHCFTGSISIISLVVQFVPYIFLIVCVFDRNIKTVNYGFVSRIFALSVLWVCCILIVRLMIQSNFRLDVAFINMQRLGLSEEEVKGLVVNPNSLGIQCVLAVSCLTQLRINRQKNIGDTFLIFSILILGSLTVSRTYLACLLILIIYILLFSDGGIRKKTKLILGMLLILVVVIVLINLLFPSVLELFIQRLEVDDITGGRGMLMETYNNYIFSSPKTLFWGIGLLGFGNKVINVYNIADSVPHNGIQEVLLAWGCPGLILFIFIFLVLIRRSKQENQNQTLINYLPLIIWVAKIMVGQVITSSYTMLAIVSVYLSLCYDLSSAEEQKQ